MSKNIHNSEINKKRTEVRFPLKQLSPTAPHCFPSHHQQHGRQHNWQQMPIVRNSELYYNNINTCDNFPLKTKRHQQKRFPLGNLKERREQQLHMTQPISLFQFPQQQFVNLSEFSENNLSYPNRIITINIRSIDQQLPPSSTRSYETVQMESPTIKNQFVNLLNNLYGKLANGNVGHGNRSSQHTNLVPSPKTEQTMTPSCQHDKTTEIDMIEKETHCRTSDNEPNALEQIITFNLNVKVLEEKEELVEVEAEEIAKGVGEQKMEIEHQQAENFNDAFGQHRHDRCDYDAMDVAKNKHEICEQSKLERNQQKESRDELNMNKAVSKILENEEQEWSRQSICMAREQTIDGHGTASNHQLLAVDLSDTRETSSEQVDDQHQPQQQQQRSHIKFNGSIVTRPNIEILKSAVHAFLTVGEPTCPFPLARKQLDLDLIDFLSYVIEVLFSSVGARTKQVNSGECADMTVSKVSEEQDSEAAIIVVAGDVYPDQIDLPSEVEDNNNSNRSRSESQTSDMKYELKSTASSTLPISNSRTSISNQSPTAAETSPTSRIRNSQTPTRPLLGDLKRSSSSRDDISESVLPERTRLRRQRRMRSQDSVEEKPEDVIERLNKLKARISGALSEVKGVLKQYSTESETEAAPPPPPPVKPVEPQVMDTSVPPPPPVAFRFVKKVRRRSYFDEADEEQEQAIQNVNQQGTTAKVNEKEEQIKKDIVNNNTQHEVNENVAGNIVEKNHEKFEKLPEEKPREEALLSNKKDNGEINNSPAETKIDFLKKVRSELKWKPPNDENKTSVPIIAPVATATTTTTTTKTTTLPSSESVTLDAVTPMRDKIKKKVIVKAKNPRRASIAAVEPSKIKIEPSVEQIDALITQRRPSDSEAIVKRKKEKLMGARATTISSGITKETVTKQPKVQQKPATPTNEQLSTPKVNADDAVAAKIKTKSFAKTDKGDDGSTAAAAAATAAETAAAAATATPTASTTATSTIVAAATTATATATAAEALATQPEQLKIDEGANQSQTSDRTSHDNHKLAELISVETQLVVVPAVANSQGAETSQISSSPVISSSLSESKKPINQSTASFEAPPTPELVAIVDDIEDAEKSAPQIAATLSEVSYEQSSLQQQQQQHEQQQDQQQEQQAHQQQQQAQSEQVEATKDKIHTHPSDSLAAMPELKVLSGPVQPVKIETVDQSNDETKIANQLSVAKKKAPHLKKLVRKNSIDKDKDKEQANDDKLKNILRNKNKITELSSRLNKLTPPKKISKPNQGELVNVEEQNHLKTVEGNDKDDSSVEVLDNVQTDIKEDEKLESEPVEEQEPEPKPIPIPKQRKIKKKVIIKRQKRRLSISDSFFIQPETEEPKLPEIETIEKAIAYVTDDEADEEPDGNLETDPAKPLKSCLHVREYKIGDLVLYAERYRKTQVRWKRGRVLERITSISYKLEIEGKEVAAHISYIKKYTGRKVRFGGKEYLEIDYEQVAEEERRARSYSIWNMV